MFVGDVLDIMEYRHDWAKFNFTPKLFEYVITQLIPDVIFHTREQDQNQIRDNYDREPVSPHHETITLTMRYRRR